MSFGYNAIRSTLHGALVSRYDTPHLGAEFAAHEPSIIVLHYTATLSAKHAFDLLMKDDREVSAHVLIDRDGSITQMVPLNRIAWHAGESEWKGRTRINKYSLGIEIVNAGMLTQDAGGNYSTWFGTSVSKKEVYTDHSGTHWHRFPAIQVKRALELTRFLQRQFNIKDIVGHNEISPRRKHDPGPAFPLERFR